MKNPLKIVWIVLGFLCLGLGTIGIVLPILPTVPFYMATLFCFAKSSKKLHDWFIGTNLYKKHLDSFVKKITIQEISKTGIQNIGKTIEVMAEAEGLTAHKNAVSLRLKSLENGI